MGKNPQARDKYSGGLGLYQLLNDDGTPNGEWVDLGILSGGELGDETPEEESGDEGGVTYYDDGTRKVKYTQKIMQRDRATLRLAIETLRGKTFRLLKEESRVKIGGVYQYFFAPVCKMSPSVKWSRPGNEVSCDILIQDNASAVTLASVPSGMRTTLTAGAFTVAAHGYWDIIEQS